MTCTSVNDSQSIEGALSIAKGLSQADQKEKETKACLIALILANMNNHVADIRCNKDEPDISTSA